MSAVQNIAVPPHNLEAEKSVLGAVLLDERHLHSLLVEEQLRPEHFYREQHGWVFAAMLELYESDRKIDHPRIIAADTTTTKCEPRENRVPTDYWKWRDKPSDTGVTDHSGGRRTRCCKMRAGIFTPRTP